MKITKTNEEYDIEQARRRKANVGCGKCPCCGCSTPMRLNPDLRRRWFHWEWKDKYKCEKCGAEWEGDWYRGK